MPEWKFWRLWNMKKRLSACGKWEELTVRRKVMKDNSSAEIVSETDKQDMLSLFINPILFVKWRDFMDLWWGRPQLGNRSLGSPKWLQTWAKKISWRIDEGTCSSHGLVGSRKADGKDLRLHRRKPLIIEILGSKNHHSAPINGKKFFWNVFEKWATKRTR